MGVNDAAEMLEVAKAECVRLEIAHTQLSRLHEVATERNAALQVALERETCARIAAERERDSLVAGGAESYTEIEARAILCAADWLERIRYDTWNGGTRRPSNYARAATDIRRYATSERNT